MCDCRIHRLPVAGRERAITDLFLKIIERNWDKRTAMITRSKITLMEWREVEHG